MDQQRAFGSTKERLDEWFRLFKQVIDCPGVIPSNVYNMDESGIQLEVLWNAKRLVAGKTVSQILKSPHDRESITVVECISCIGQALTHMIITKAKTHQNQWYPQRTSVAFSWHFGISPNGYMDN